MDGVLNINKLSGMTSHDVVQKARGIIKEKRIGHTGTLDPMATGVLVLCVGKATRIAQYLEAGEKEYQTVMRLGVTTDTLDAEGRVLETRPYTPPDERTIVKAMQGFIGSIMQRPPAYSAIKIAGVPSYKLAREGKAEPLAPRQVTIHRIDLTAFEDPFVSLTVQCSKGVYIRTLCADIGEVLGMGAHVTSLARTRSGRFTLDRSVTLDQLRDRVNANELGQVFTSIDDAVDAFPAVPINAADAQRILHGNQISCPASLANSGTAMVRIHDLAGGIIALARIQAGFLKPELVFS